MVTWPKASSTPSLAITRLARASRTRASSSLFGTGISPFDIFVVLARFGSRRPPPRRQLEALEREAGRDRAAGKRPIAEAFRRLPRARRHRDLRNLAAGEIGAKADDFFLGAVDHRQLQRRAGVIVPDLDRVDAVPVRALAARQQEQDRGRSGAAVDRAGIAEGLAVVPAFRMRLEIERTDDIGGGNC